MGLSFVLVAAWAESAAAQCVMGAKSAEFAGGESGQGWNTLVVGALILIVPATAFCVAMRSLV